MAKQVHTEKPGFWSAVTSPVGRKVLTGVTGIVWVLFVILHMVGNLGYFASPEAYNLYSDFLLGTGPLLYLVEFVLVVTLLIHAALGIQIYLRKRRAREQGYSTYKTAGRPSLQSPSSRTMIFTGLILLVFLVIHLDTFKFGPGIDEGYVANVDGRSVEEVAGVAADNVVIRDLSRLVTEKFQNPLYAFGYPAIMILLGFHLRHGIWSALQSLGAMSSRLTPLVYGIGTVLAIGIAAGFLVLPLYIFFFVS